MRIGAIGAVRETYWLAFAIYSKNVPKLGRGKNSDKSKLVKRLRYAWAQFICRCGFRPSTQERLDKLLSTFLFLLE